MQKIKVYKGEVLLLDNPAELEDYFKSLEDGLLTFDWETTGLEHNAVPLGLSLHQRGSSPCFVPVDFFFEKGISMKTVADICNKEFPRFKMIAHNAKYDSMINVMNGIKDESCNIVADTLIMVHLYNPALDKQLEKRVKADFGYGKNTFENISGKKWNNINWAREGDELLPLLAGYSGEDTYWTTQLYYKYKPLLDDDAWRVHDRIEIPMVKILRDAKIRGVLIDVPLLNEMKEHAEKRLHECANKIYDIAGCVFNLNSSKQKKDVFFDKLKLPVISTTSTGAESTDANSAKMWSAMGYPIGKALVEYSELQKLLSGYLKPIPVLVDGNNVLRGDINSCGTQTGRCSSSNPNLQNQPNNPEFPVRKAFVARQGYAFINYDYSQLELRVMAHMSKDAKFMDIFLHGRDPHGEVAKACGITRKQAKVMNFGVLYGMGPDKYERTFNVSRERALQMIDDYHNTYEGFSKWKTATENYAKKHGYVKNLFGRIRRFTEATKNPFEGIDKRKYFGELRQAVNCVDTETEIFTKRGWLRYDEVHEGDIALTYNGGKDVMEWQPILQVVRMPYVGDMVSMEGEAHSSLSTPNHRWFVRDDSIGPCVTRDSEFIFNMSKKGSYRFPLCTNIISDDNPDFSDEWLELFGVFITDGFHESLHQIGLCQSTSKRKEGNIERIGYLISKVGDEVVRERDHSWGDYDVCHYWTLRGEFTEWCKKVTNQMKRVTDKSWLCTLSQRQASKLLDGIILGDGYKSKSCKTVYIGNIHKYMIDFYAEVALLAGKSYGISVPGKDAKNRDYVLSIKSRGNVYCGLLERKKVHYNGIVWCPRVENQSFLMRRNDKVCITRNTIIQGTGADIVKLATVAMCKKFVELNLDAHFLLQVHDEILIEARIDQMREIERVVIDCMENTVKLDVPLIADGKILANWGEMKDDSVVSLPDRFDYSLYASLCS